MDCGDIGSLFRTQSSLLRVAARKYSVLSAFRRKSEACRVLMTVPTFWRILLVRVLRLSVLSMSFMDDTIAVWLASC